MSSAKLLTTTSEKKLFGNAFQRTHGQGPFLREEVLELHMSLETIDYHRFQLSIVNYVRMIHGS